MWRQRPKSCGDNTAKTATVPSRIGYRGVISEARSGSEALTLRLSALMAMRFALDCACAAFGIATVSKLSGLHGCGRWPSGTTSHRQCA